MKNTTTTLFSQIITILLLIGLYILYLLHFFGILELKCKSIIPQPFSANAVFKGPYESCEDTICPMYDASKKTCMCDKKDMITSCCQQSCGDNQYCKDSCVPIFDPCV